MSNARKSLGDERVSCGADEWYVYEEKDGSQYRQCAPCAVNRNNKGDRKRLYRHGITKERLEELESGGCDICGQDNNLCVDHNHNTGEIRGALCSSCNRAIGLLGDTKEDLVKAVEYLSN